MLKEVCVDNFRSCVAVRIQNIGSMLALLGRNGTGKTNILRAIGWAARSATATEALHPEGQRRKVTLQVDLVDQQFEYCIATRRVRQSSTDIRQGFELDLVETISLRSS